MQETPNISNDSRIKNFVFTQKRVFKDSFIPSEENNYYPKSLHPRRLVFYALTALVVKFIVITIIILYPLGAWLTPDILSVESKRIIQLTNQIRKSNGLPELVDNTNLTASATQKVQDMLINQYFAHIGPDQTGLVKWLNENNYQFNTAGENLAMGFMTAEDVVNAWVKSPTHYANLIDPSYKEIGVAMTSGYYNKIDTTLAAQHFASPKKEILNENNKVEISAQTINKNVESFVTIVPAGNDIEKNINDTVIEKLNLEKIQTEQLPKTQPSSYEPYIIFPKNNDLINNLYSDFIVFSPEDSQLIFRVNNKTQTPAIIQEGKYVQAQLVLKTGENSVRVIAKNKQGISISSKETKVFVDDKTPAYNRPETYVKLTSPVGQKQTILEVQIVSDEKLKSAEVEVGNYHVNLQKNGGDNVWRGSLIIYDRYAKDFFNPVILPTAKFTDLAGNTTITDIDWKNIQPVKTSFLDQYFFIKAQENTTAKPIINFANNYYKVLLGVFIIALQLNIFVKIKHQQPVAIINAVAIIGLLIWLIII